jgi:hypothetical protein
MLKHENLQLPELVDKLMCHLEEKGYALGTRNHFLAYYKVLFP